MKNKMCLLYEFHDYASNDTTVIERFDGTTKPQCMLSCVRDNYCSAFNFHSNDGKCELLDTSEGCMSYDLRMGTIFVQLTQCDGTAPWRVVSPALEKLQWKDPRHIGDREFIRFDAERHVARIIYQGIYMTGYLMSKKDDELFVVDMNGDRIYCSLFVEVLTCVNSSDYSWLDYAPGEPIPSSAVGGGFGQDGIPVYVICIKLADWKLGYYSDRNKMLYVKGLKKDKTPKAVKILVEN